MSYLDVIIIVDFNIWFYCFSLTLLALICFLFLFLFFSTMISESKEESRLSKTITTKFEIEKFTKSNFSLKMKMRVILRIIVL